MRVLIYDCFAGISGDMNLAGLLDLGVPEEFLLGELAKLNLHGYRIQSTRDSRRSVTGTRVEVIVDDPHLDHGHEGQGGRESHGHAVGKGHAHARTGLDDISALISSSALSPVVKEHGIAIFTTLARAEAAVHGISEDEVHFHEVGGVDAIVDIVGAAICLDWLRVDEVWCGAVELGSGTVRCAHGVFPVPAPATAGILARRGIPVTSGRMPFEATTPTGAAILATCVDRFTQKAAFTPERIGYGLGTRDAETPNALRIFLGTAAGSMDDLQKDVSEEVGVIVECTVDDMTGEGFGTVMDDLFAAGARDVTFSPVVMKKSRPGNIISVLCTESEAAAIRRILFVNTTTIGLRQHSVRKLTLRREEEQLAMDGGIIRVKHVYYDGRLLRSKPEQDDCRSLAVARGVPTQLVANEVQRILAERNT